VRASGGRRCWGLVRLRAGRIHARGVLGADPLLGKRLIFLLPRAVGERSRADEAVDFSAGWCSVRRYRPDPDVRALAGP
jgi:hypothetical protein